MKMDTKSKIRLITRTFLAANKGQSFTGKQICEFINTNKLGLKGGVQTNELGGLLDKNFCYAVGIHRQRKNGRNVWHYSIKGGCVYE